MSGNAGYRSKKNEPQWHLITLSRYTVLILSLLCFLFIDHAVKWQFTFFFFFFQNVICWGQRNTELWHISIYNDFKWGFFSLFFSVKSSMWEKWTKTNKIQYSILKTLKRVTTFWLYYTVRDSTHTHTKNAPTNKKKSTDSITNHFCLWADTRGTEFVGCPHSSTHHRKTLKWDILHRRHS